MIIRRNAADPHSERRDPRARLIRVRRLGLDGSKRDRWESEPYAERQARYMGVEEFTYLGYSGDWWVFQEVMR